jgi:proteasome accessory factor C
MSAKRGPRPTEERLRGLLVMLPWLLERGRTAVPEMAAHFGLSPQQLVDDLLLVAMCGRSDSPGEMIEVVLDDDDAFVEIGTPRFFTKPMGFNADEAFALLTATTLAMEMPGFEATGPLGRALAKLVEVVGDPALVIDEDRPPFADDVAAAAADVARLRIGYRSASSDTVNEREVTPRLVFPDRGEWYLVADDLSEGGKRKMFRIDRIEACTRTGAVDSFEHVDPPDTDIWYADNELPVVTLSLPLAARWVAERDPHRAGRAVDDGIEVDLTVADEQWLDELLVRVGAQGRVVAPAAWAGRGAAAARRLLARYEAAGSADN